MMLSETQVAMMKYVDGIETVLIAVDTAVA
jgi:hypothetical protein